MPKAKSAEKQARASQRKRIHNQATKSKLRSAMGRFFEFKKTDAKIAAEKAREVVSLLDRAAKTRVLHVNTARRHKSRVMARLQTLAK